MEEADKQNRELQGRKQRSGEFCRLKRAAMLSVLQECTDALAVYQYTLKEPSMRAHIDIDCIPTEVRLENPTNSSKIQTWDQQAEYVEIQDSFEKLLRDSTSVGRLIEDIQQDIRSQGSIDSLPNKLFEVIKQKEEEQELIERANKLSSAIQNLKLTMKEEEKQFQKTAEQLNVELFTAKNREAKLETTASIESSYVNAWEKSRREQNYLRRSGSLERRSVLLERCFIHEKNEDRVAWATQAFLRQSVLRSEEKTQYWKDRHQEESQTYREEIQSLEEKINEQRKNLQTLQSEYDSRQKFIDSYLAEKELVKRQRDHEAHMQRSAIKIQAWWRGVMVRRKLGPYRAEEKKKKRAAAKGKK